MSIWTFPPNTRDATDDEVVCGAYDEWTAPDGQVYRLVAEDPAPSPSTSGDTKK